MPPYKQLAAKLRLLAHPVRLQILDALRNGPACVCHLQTIVGRPQAYVSQQLAFLREGDLLTSKREGQFIYYEIADQDVLAWLEEILGPAFSCEPINTCTCPACTSSTADELATS